MIEVEVTAQDIPTELRYRLDPLGHPTGVGCDAQGPFIGPIRLLAKTSAGFAPRPLEHLNRALSWTFEHPADFRPLLPGLQVAATALNDGDLARAMIATLHLRLPTLTDRQASRAVEASQILKASPDDPIHPGWPAGTEGGLGGKFRPKDGALATEAERAVEDRVERLIRRRAIRTGLRRFLQTRALRLFGEGLSNLIPAVDAAGDAAMAADLAGMAEDYETLRAETQAAIDFAEEGPRTLEQLQVSEQDESFSSFDAFKKTDFDKRFGSAGNGYEYHHIVEQSAGNEFSAAEIQSTKNIVRIPKILHEEINSEYGLDASPEEKGFSLRASMKGKSFEEQWEEGLKIMEKIGILRR